MNGSAIAVYGATGHTGQLVAAELVARGHRPLLAGRDAAKLAALADRLDTADTRVVDATDPSSLRDLAADSSVIVNCAGPFTQTGHLVAAAAVAEGCHYLDHAVEPLHVKGLFDSLGEQAAQRGCVVVPGMSCFGATGDLLAAVVAAGLSEVERVTVAYAVNGWRMTAGSTSTARQEVGGANVIFADGAVQVVPTAPAPHDFDFPSPIGRVPVVRFPAGEVLTIPRHVPARAVDVVMTRATFQEDAVFSSEHIDPADRAGSRFTLAVHVESEHENRTGRLHGNDIYGFGATMSVEAAIRLTRGATAATGGVLAAAEVFPAADFLATLWDLDLVTGPHLVSA